MSFLPTDIYEKIALLYKKDVITYKKLSEKVKEYQVILDSVKEQFVFIPMTNTPETVYKILGCIDSNKIFIPINSIHAFETAEQLHSDIPSSCFFGETLSFFENQKVSLTLDVDTLFIGFTSGTTGQRKGFVRNKKSWLDSFDIFQSVPTFYPKSYVTCLTPLHYSLGLYVLLQTISKGQTFILNITSLNDKLLTPDILKDLQLFSVPTVFNDCLKDTTHLKNESFDIILSGESITTNQRINIKKKLPMSHLFTFYGTSETSFISYHSNSLPVENSVGHLFPFVNLAIKDSINDIGEIAIKSPMMFQGYLINGRLQEAELSFLTGDVGTYQEELYLYGRKDQRINRKGEKIFPLFLEQALVSHEAIEDVLIYGKKHDDLGEQVIAEIVFKHHPVPLMQLNNWLTSKSYRKMKIDTLYPVTKIAYSQSGKKTISKGENDATSNDY